MASDEAVNFTWTRSVGNRLQYEVAQGGDTPEAVLRRRGSRLETITTRRGEYGARWVDRRVLELVGPDGEVGASLGPPRRSGRPVFQFKDVPLTYENVRPWVGRLWGGGQGIKLTQADFGEVLEVWWPQTAWTRQFASAGVPKRGAGRTDHMARLGPDPWFTIAFAFWFLGLVTR